MNLRVRSVARVSLMPVGVALMGSLALVSLLTLASPERVGAQDAPAQRNAAQSRSDSGPACFSPAATKAVEACPSNAPTAPRRAGNAPVSRLDTVQRRETATKQKQTGPSVELSLSQRTGREREIQARAETLLNREIQLTQRLVRNTRQTAPQRPDILLRLAELYFEKQALLNARVRSFDEPIFQAEQRKNAGRVRQLQNEQRQAEQGLDGVRQEAIRVYATLVQDHPDFPRMDEVLFSLAFGLEEMRQHERARQVYYRLIKGYPASRFVPHAWLSFAEFYFAEGEMENARQFYSKVIEIPPERNPVYGYALYKQAWAAYNLEDFQGALEQFVRTIEFAQQNPEARDAENLARQSRRELVLPYSRVAPAGRALDFFRRYTTNNEQALETLENLGELYFDTGQWPNTITVYQKLITESPRSDKTCYWQSRISNAIISSRPKDEQVREVQRMIDLYDTFSGGGHAAESVNQCKQLSATILVELATAWHREAIGTEEQPGTNDRATMALSARLYRIVIEKFPEMEQMQFPEIDRRDWPTLYKVSYYYAELLWKMEDWAQCGPAFDKVVEINPGGEYTSDAAYAAVLCYNNLYQQRYERTQTEVRTSDAGGRRPTKGRGRGRQAEAAPEPTDAERFASRAFDEVETGMLNAFQRFICFVRDSEELPTIKYRRARIFYEANHFEEAAILFKDIALNHRDSDLAEYAANLYLDSLNVLGTKVTPPRVECINELETAIGPLKQAYCNTSEMRSSHEELCGVLDTLELEVKRKQADALYANGRFAECGRAYVQLFRQFPQYEKNDEVLYSSATCFARARLLGRAIQVRKVLIERFPESRLAKRAVFLVGSNYHALAIYSQAAEYYEQFARRFPGESFPIGRPTEDECNDEERASGDCAVAHEALTNAVFFRLGLGEEDQAIEDARLFETNYARRLPRQTSQVVFSIGTIYERQENWTKVVDHYRDFLRTFARTALPSQTIQANVQIGRAYWRANDKRHAEEPFRAAVTAWTRGAPAAIAALPDATDAEKAQYLDEAKDAASEALFYLAEYKFAEVEAIAFPTYRGGRSATRVTAWAQGEFVQWYTRKAEAIGAATAEYNRIAELDVPRWKIAAAARIGQMWRGFVDNFRSAPVPDEIANDDELAAAYEGALDEASERYVREAIDKFEFCLLTATQVRWFNEWSQTCEQELNKLNPADYPLADELRGVPSYVRSTAAQPAAVELGEGGNNEDAAEVEGGGES